jgi:hypothetical protein
VKEILREAERLEVKEKVPLVLAELLLTDKLLAQIKEHRIIFLGVSVTILTFYSVTGCFRHLSFHDPS